ncbi:hypothetical protein [Methylocystis parvus]|uniref:Uncharacterized protein n=1 Tax=Methylocystis parvus TaxID=134 RepID=A0A6B8MF55_9HYPH|nr:hypothetical protein [Methylocystis parvus]QGN00170.1 hypothetical protein F7D14_21640 [Methylocystis parvus]WBK02522.1 hypothetical protein MMG94_20995 [Methylocystis parvus OBBP]
MNFEPAKDIADAVLFEGYILYPYRASALKNRQRWTFGGLFPRDYAGDEPSSMQTEILVKVADEGKLDVTLRFLHTQRRQILNAKGDDVDVLDLDGKQYVAWDEAVVREVTASGLALKSLCVHPETMSFSFPAESSIEPLPDARGAIQRSCQALQGVTKISATPVEGSVVRVRVQAENTTPLRLRLSRAEAQHYGFLSTHTILGARGCAFVSLLDPPEALAAAAAGCQNLGTWPVLAGEESATDIMLSSPIILYDYPKVAPQSKSQFFDATEIDEMLTLRVLTLTNEEQLEMAATDPGARAILEQCQALSRDQLSNLHGALRKPMMDGAALTVGSHVRLNPKDRGDIFDMALNGKIAVVQAIERDFENRLHVAVTLLDDPGGDLGENGFSGHRFFFSTDEVERVGGLS